MDADRIERVRTGMQDRGLDALICSLPENVLFLSGYWPMAGVSFLVFPFDGDPVCIVPATEEPEARAGLWNARCVSYPYGVLSAGDMRQAVDRLLRDCIKGKRWARVGFEGSFETLAPPLGIAEPATLASVTFSILEGIWSGRRLVDASELLFSLRSRKTAQEAEKLRRCNEMARFGFEAFVSGVREGKRGVDLVAEAEASIITRGMGYKGASSVRAIAQVTTGKAETARGYRPVVVSSGRKLLSGDIALLELAVVADGFWCDRTRAVVAGKATDIQKELFGVVRRAQEAAIRTVRTGVAAGEVDAAARRTIDDAGHGKEFLHITGHGTGFRYHEPIPIIAPGSPTILEQGMVFTVEPGIYSEQWGGIRREENVLVTETGAEVLGPFDEGPI